MVKAPGNARTSIIRPPRDRVALISRKVLKPDRHGLHVTTLIVLHVR